MMRTTLLTTMVFFPVLMLQAADPSCPVVVTTAPLDPNQLVAYYEFQATYITAMHGPTARDAQMIADLKASKPQSFPVDAVSVNLYSAPLPSPEESMDDALKLFIQHSRKVAQEYDFLHMYKNAQSVERRESVLHNISWFAARFMHVRAAQKANPVEVQVDSVKKHLQDVTNQSFDSVRTKLGDASIAAWLATDLKSQLDDIIQQEAVKAQ